ncbi:hypothetical protein [Kaarinaea lacus]
MTSCDHDDCLEVYCPHCEAMDYLPLEDMLADKTLHCQQCGHNYYWRHCNQCETGFVAEEANAPCIECSPKEMYSDTVDTKNPFLDSFMHSCPVCNKRYISLLIYLNKGSRFCRRCKSLLIMQHMNSGTAKMITLMIALVFLKEPLFSWLGKELSLLLLIGTLALIFLLGTRHFFTIKAH